MHTSAQSLESKFDPVLRLLNYIFFAGNFSMSFSPLNTSLLPLQFLVAIFSPDVSILQMLVSSVPPQ